MRDKMEIGQRYRQNSTGSEALCVAHDQGECVIRYTNRSGGYPYVLRSGTVGKGKTEWTKVGVVKRIRRKVHQFGDTVRLDYCDQDINKNVVVFVFEDDKLINVEMLNN